MYIWLRIRHVACLFACRSAQSLLCVYNVYLSAEQTLPYVSAKKKARLWAKSSRKEISTQNQALAHTQAIPHPNLPHTFSRLLWWCWWVVGGVRRGGLIILALAGDFSWLKLPPSDCKHCIDPSGRILHSSSSPSFNHPNRSAPTHCISIYSAPLFMQIKGILLKLKLPNGLSAFILD